MARLNCANLARQLRNGGIAMRRRVIIMTLFVGLVGLAAPHARAADLVKLGICAGGGDEVAVAPAAESEE